MGMAKAAMMEHEENLNWARNLLARTHAIRTPANLTAPISG